MPTSASEYLPPLAPQVGLRSKRSSHDWECCAQDAEPSPAQCEEQATEVQGLLKRTVVNQ